MTDNGNEKWTEQVHNANMPGYGFAKTVAEQQNPAQGWPPVAANTQATRTGGAPTQVVINVC